MPTRADGLSRLASFIPRMGADYTAYRNEDRGPVGEASVSELSPWIRPRLLLESELIRAAITAHGATSAESFIQQVFWRSYFKGWLELRPSVWRDYRNALTVPPTPALHRAILTAERGETGIDCFDHWVAELTSRGTLHNHARLWFASIWIFTLKLPWQFGADFFLRHLLDGDAASNTLSWRWVGGLQTVGKHYIARADNIARFTQGRFRPTGQLTETPLPLPAEVTPPPGSLSPLRPIPKGPAGLLLHDDDVMAETLALNPATILSVAAFSAAADRSPQGSSAMVGSWCRGAAQDGLDRAAAHFAVPGLFIDAAAIVDWATESGLKTILTPWAPVGWTADRLDAIQQALAARSIALIRLRRPWDEACWPRATKGYFGFRQHIPELIGALI